MYACAHVLHLLHAFIIFSHAARLFGLDASHLAHSSPVLPPVPPPTLPLPPGEGWKHISSALPAGTLHLIGLLSDGGVHSRTNQLFGLLRGAAQRGAKRVRLHVLTDGRDVPDGSSLKFVEELEGVLAELTVGGGLGLVGVWGGGVWQQPRAPAHELAGVLAELTVNGRVGAGALE
jgi:hypothetical protein